ncbi:uncharacterized protein LOC118356331 [Zalophus californianus]|uniref:Uncharacterized protein LOC118356331 n=1 Tax=Zalophus californianus TaxID=9704 RepID=A0A6P9EZF9_ZALCA|nr:uncharacterized protein LOC118356331 [Zalophus californianus]
MSGRRASTEERGAGRLAAGRRLRAAAREREGASRCQGTSSAREQRPRPGSGSTALGLAPAGPGALARPPYKAGRELRDPPAAAAAAAAARLPVPARGPETRQCRKARPASAPAAHRPHVFRGRASWPPDLSPRPPSLFRARAGSREKETQCPASLAGAGDTWKGHAGSRIQPWPSRGPIFRRLRVLLSPSVCFKHRRSPFGFIFSVSLTGKPRIAQREQKVPPPGAEWGETAATG